MKDFKLISEAEDSYHIAHNNGRKFTVDKKGLSPKAHDAIKTMCNGGMADGGSVQKLSEDGTVSNSKPTGSKAGSDVGAAALGAGYAKAFADDPNSWVDHPINNLVKLISPPTKTTTATAGYADGGKVQKLNSDGTVEDDNETDTSEPAPQGNAQEAVATAPAAGSADSGISAAIPGYGDALNKNVESKIQAVGDYQKEAGEASKATQDIYNNVAQQIAPPFTGASEHTAQEVLDMTPQELAKRSPAQIQSDGAAMDAKFMETLQKQSKDFDPMRYVHNMGTGQKILTGIAIALGGAGAGKGNTNQALETLNRAINNDAEHQKFDYSNTMNLYKMNHQATQDALQSSLMTKNQLISVAQMQIAAQGARANNAKDVMNNQMTMADLQQQKDRNNMIRGLLQNRTPGPDGKMSGDPEMVIRQVLQDPHQQQAALESLHKNLDVENTRQILNKSFNDVANMKLGGKLSPADREGALNSASLVASSKLHMKPAVVKEMLNGIFPGGNMSGLESEDTTNNNRARLNQLLDSQKVQMGPFKASDFQSTSQNPLTKMTTAELQQHNIAQSNPSHPESVRFHQRMIKKYGTSY